MKSATYQARIEQESGLFAFSAFMFRLGLAFVTFEQVRPYFDIQLSDYCFFLSLTLLFSHPKSRLTDVKGSGILFAGCLILCGALLSLRNSAGLTDAAVPLARLFVLFGLFAPLALIHSKQLGKNLLYIVVGIFANCTITLLQAWFFPGIVKTLSINPGSPDLSDIGRWQGLTSHPNTLGFSAALAILIVVALLSYRETAQMRGRLILIAFVCSIGAVLSGSRTVLVALIPALLVFAILDRWKRREIAWALLTPIIIWGALNYFVPGAVSGYTERFSSSGADYMPDSSRVITAAMTLTEISQKPLLGWGVDYFGDAAKLITLEDGEEVGTEFTFLRYWYAAGLLGAIGFLALFALPMWQVARALKSSASIDSEKILRLALASYVLLFIASAVHPLLYNRYLYVPMFLFSGFSIYSVRAADSGSILLHR